MPPAPATRGRHSRLAWLLALSLAAFVVSCWERDPGLRVSTRAIDFGGQLDSLSITVWNAAEDGLLTSGVTTLEYTIAADQAWVTVRPASGQCGEGEDNRHAVEIDRTLLQVGINLATIKVSSNGGSWSIAVSAHRDGAVCSVPPTAPADPTPGDGLTGVSINQDLWWGEGDTRCPGVAVRYAVHFGTTSPPPFDHDNGSVKTWDPGTLLPGTTYYWMVVAEDAGGSTSGPEWSFTTAGAACTTAPTAPSGPTPAAGASGIAVDANLSWAGGTSQCAGLTATYDVYFGTTSPPPLAQNTGSTKAWDPGTLTNSTTYYWRVVAKDANGSTSGPEWSFTTTAAPCVAAPTAPSGPTPAAGASGIAVDANLSWAGGTSQCAGLTATYDVYFGTTSPPPLAQNTGSTKAWDPGTLTNSTTYYWRVVAKDANGSTSGPEWSFTTTAAPCVAAPTAPSGPTPATGASGIAVDANLSWAGGTSQCAGLTATYDVYFGTTSPPPLAQNTGSTKAWDPGTLTNSTTYYWRVVAKDANGSTSGPEWSFTTTAAPCVAAPTAPSGPTPAAGAIDVPIDQDLAWTEGTSQCAGLTATYNVYFGTSSPPPLDHDNGAAKTWDPGTLAYGTTYYWRIVAKDANGTTPGPLWTFTTSAAPCTAVPTAPAGPAPPSGGTDIAVGQDLSWTEGTSQCAGLTATYDVYFGTTSPPSFDHDNGTAKTWDPGTLANSTTYYWRIVAKDANGATSGPEWSFTTEPPCLDPPSAPCSPVPANGQTNVNENANLAWGCGDSQCTGLTAVYDVYFGTNPTPGPDQFRGTTAAKAWTLPRLEKLTTYYWRIVARDANGESPGPVWSFTIRN